MTLAAIAFDPAIRGILVTLVGVVVLFGSVYVILATNTGARAGFLIAITGLMGWMFSLSLFWWIYGIGLIGEMPTWVEREINFDRSSQTITENFDRLPPPDELPDPNALLLDFEDANPGVREQIESTEGEGFEPESLTEVVTLVPEIKVDLDDEMLNGWRILPESDSRRGEAVAAADAALAEGAVFGQETSPASYTIQDVFLFGGKGSMEPETIPGEQNVFERAWNRIISVFQVKNPPQYAAITLAAQRRAGRAAGRGATARAGRRVRLDGHGDLRAQPRLPASHPGVVHALLRGPLRDVRLDAAHP